MASSTATMSAPKQMEPSEVVEARVNEPETTLFWSACGMNHHEPTTPVVIELGGVIIVFLSHFGGGGWW